MTRTELFKLRTHRTPWVLLAIMITSVLIAPIYFAIKEPTDATVVLEAFSLVFAVMAPLLGVIFGGWIFGHEFRQGTLRRVLGSDARRGRLIATKAVIGLIALTAGIVIAAGLGALASTASVASFGETPVWDGVFRDLLSGGLPALVTASMAFGISILLRSDTYGMLGALALMTIVGPILQLIPRVGKYMPSALANDVTAWVAGSDDLVVKIVPASLGLAASIAFVMALATTTFYRRDI